MNPHDYIISVDENSEPYLEHALFGKGGQKKNHKYYTRAQDNGRWRYFYSPEEFRIWQSGGSKKKVSNTEKMRSAFKQLKETGRKAVDTAADKLGVDERKAAQEAWAQVPKHINSSDKKAMKALKKATAADNEYFKTPLGKAESFKDRLEEDARGLVSDVADRVKSKSERMREEFRKKVQEKADDIKETYEHNKRQFEKAKEMEKAETERQKMLANRPTAHKKPEAIGTAKDGAMKRRSMKNSQQQSNSGSGRSIDPHKASPEFMLEAGYNSGLDVSALKVADARHAKAQRAYNKALSNPNTSSQEKDRLFRELTKAEKAYYDEAEKIADELKQK